MTLKEAYVTMKLYWSFSGMETPEAIKKYVEEVFSEGREKVMLGRLSKAHVTSVGGIKKQ
jgi:hypothetical protein